VNVRISLRWESHQAVPSRSGLTALPICRDTPSPGRGLSTVCLRVFEQRFFQYVSYDGTLFPRTLSVPFEDGVQTSRVNYQLISPNRSIDEQVFAKPAGIKSIR
jgi:hypothetical protein